MNYPNQALLFSLFMGLMGPISSLAIPVKYSTCSDQVKVKDVPGSNGYFFDETCTRLYVVPPKMGSLKITGYAPTSTIDDDCEKLSNLADEQKNYSEIQKIRSERLLDLEKEAFRLEKNLKKNRVPPGMTVKEVETLISQLMDSISDLKEEMNKWETENDLKKLNASQGYGASGTILLESRYEDLIKAFKDANQHLKDLGIERLPLDNNFISINEKTDDPSKANRMPAVLSLTLIGIGEMPLLASPGIALNNKDYVPYSTPDGAKIFGGSLPGEIELSLIGACAVRKNSGNPSEFTAGDISDYIASSSTYSYQVQVTRKHFITYDLRELVRQIHEQTKKGGMFSRKTLNSFIDERTSTSWIEFHVESQDTRFEYTDEYIKEVKKEFIDRALAQVIAIQTGSSTALLALIDPSGKNGADTIGDELQKCPNMYCQIGAAGFKVLSSIFGSQKATSNLLKTLSGSATELVVEKKMVPQYDTFGFE